MNKFHLGQIFTFLVVLCSFVSARLAYCEELQEKYKEYHSVDSTYLKTINGGPIRTVVDLNGKKVRIYSPEIDYETLLINPRPKKIDDAIKFPEIFFKDRAEIAVGDFKKFSEKIRSCSSEKHKSEKCYSTLNICVKGQEANDICGGWFEFDAFKRCKNEKFSTEAFLKCVQGNESALEILNKCFDSKNDYAFMFNIYGSDALFRDYYTIDVLEPMEDFSCRFSVINDQYHLISINKISVFRPGLTVIPMDLYVKHNYEKLLNYQKTQGSRKK